MTLSVVIITFNEEANIARTLASVQELARAVGGEIIVVDSGSTDKTREIAESYGAKVFVEEWKGFAAQKNSAIDKASGRWILSLDADEEVSAELAGEIQSFMQNSAGKLFLKPTYKQCHNWWKGDAESEIPKPEGKTHWVLTPDLYLPAEQETFRLIAVKVPRRNMFLGHWVQHGGFYPDFKLRLVRREKAYFENRAVHEDMRINTPFTPAYFKGALIHHAYPTLDIYIEHMRRYADLGAEMIRHKPPPILLLNRWFNPPLTFLYNYIFRLGFLDGREGFLLHWNHSRYVSWKYAKAWKLSRKKASG